MIQILFNDSSMIWDPIDLGFNYEFCKDSLRWFEQVFKSYGYIYLNDIYEHFGLKWNPDDENICLRSFNVKNLLVGTEGIMISIEYE